jgi:hypothetical protein
VSDVLPPALIPASVISVAPVAGDETGDSSDPPITARYRVIDASMIDRALAGCEKSFLDALIVRTLPNERERTQRHFTDNSAPFFSVEAMHRIVDAGVRHLLVDLPSVDRLIDEGMMAAHRVFWGLPPGPGNPETSDSDRTITELIFVPDEVGNGSCLLDLQIPALDTDAVPSRPVIYPVHPAN